MRSKFNVSKNITNRTYNGIVFDSELEMQYYRDVILPSVENNKIKYFERQKKYILQPGYKHNGKKILPIEYKADFYIKYADDSESVIDTKGYAEPLAKLKRKMFWYVYPNINYQWITYVKKFGGWIDYDECNQLRKEEKKKKKLKENKE